jgi:hypothetical protein
MTARSLRTTAYLPLRWSHAEGHCLQRELRQADRCLHPVIIVKEPQVTYSSYSQIMSYIFNMLIRVGMILLDNLLQHFLFIGMIDLSRTCGTTTSLICYALVMFMIYSWIKIKLKVLIYLSIQKSYCREFSLMARFVDALRPTPFTGANFKRWQMRVILWLTAMNVFWVSEGKPKGKLSPEKEKEYSEANTIFYGVVVGVLAETLQDTYLHYKTAKEM